MPTSLPLPQSNANKGRRNNKQIVSFYLICAVVILLINSISRFSTRSHIMNNDHPIASSFKLDNKQKQDLEKWRSAKVVFQQIQQRAISSKQTCDGLRPAPTITQINMITDTKLLPEFGITDPVSSWLSKQDIPTEEMCRLPPPKACGEVGWTVIFMSYADSSHLEKIVGNIKNVWGMHETKEIVLVWNSPRSEFNITELIEYDKATPNKFRMFYALENGLSNNLFNRYHPAIKPKTQAVLYFDDDGPIFKQRAMQIGFELWKRNAGVQVGCYARNFRFDNPDKRMHNMMETEIEVSERQILNGWQSVSPYDNQGTKQALSHIKTLDENKDRHPRFIPTCRSKTGDNLSYNWEYFHPYRAHMTLPSGTFMHRDFLCFMWHPVFEDLRQYVLDHPTHPDDVTASTIVSQVAGKALRTFTRRTKTRKNHDEDLINGATQPFLKQIKEVDQDVEDKTKQTAAIKKEISDLEMSLSKTKRRLSVIENVRYHDDNVTQRETEETLTYRHNNRHKTNNNITKESLSFSQQPITTHINNNNNNNNSSSMERRRRRRLLFKQENWGEMRTEAANSITGYFGSINPGSVGYCFGSSGIDKDKKTCGVNQYYNLDFAIEEEVPWLWEGMLGHDQC